MRLRTGNNRRRAKELKQGGLYRMPGPRGRGTWHKATREEIIEDVGTLMKEMRRWTTN